LVEDATFVSFDGGVSVRVSYCRPDSYRKIEDHGGRAHRIAWGGGYSHAAASFGAGSLVLEKIYSSLRIFVSWVYKRLLRLLFRTPFRDVSTGLRMVRRSVLEDIVLEADSPFIGAELAIKAMLKGYRVGEVGIQTFPRRFGSGNSTSFPDILAPWPTCGGSIGRFSQMLMTFPPGGRALRAHGAPSSLGGSSVHGS
jgi:hypothetical protein